MQAKLSELTKFFNLIAAQDVGTADVTGAVFVPAKDYQLFRGVAIGEALADTETLTVQLMQATAADGTGSKALSSVETLTSDGATSNPKVEVEANQDDLDAANGFVYVGLKITSNTDAIVAAGLLECGQPAFLPAS